MQADYFEGYERVRGGAVKITHETIAMERKKKIREELMQGAPSRAVLRDFFGTVSPALYPLTIEEMQEIYPDHTFDGFTWKAKGLK